jgi:hypothetical protein
MNHTYGRLVSRAAIAATVMASLLLLIKIFCVVVHRIGQYSGCTGGFSGGHRGVVNQPVGGALFAATGR